MRSTAPVSSCPLQRCSAASPAPWTLLPTLSSTVASTRLCLIEVIASAELRQVRCFSTPALEVLRALPAATLQRALSAGGVDHRHCIEKADLATTLHDKFPELPLSVRSGITAIIKAPTKEVALQDVHQALQARVSRLQLDEQYSVHLFQVHL